MSTQSTRAAARLMVAPSVILLFIWMIVPLAMTIYFSFRLYRLLSPDRTGWVGFNNYAWFLNSPDFWTAIINTLLLVGGVLIITVVLGVADRAADRPADLGPGAAAHSGDLAVLRHAAGGRVDLGEPVHAPAERTSGRSVAGVGGGTHPVPGELSDGVGDLHHILGMAALRHADPADGAAIACRPSSWRRPRWTGRRRFRGSATWCCRI